jgi:hypothetical protein
MPGRVAAAIACACALLLSAGPATARPGRAGADGGSGTYFTQGRSAYFVLTNTGTAAWQSFYVVGPPGTTFVAGANTAEITARCVAGQPDGLPNEIECGPLSANVAPAHLQMTFAATLVAPVACGATFQLAVSSSGTLPFTQAGTVTQSGSCNTASPTAVTQARVHGTSAVGHVLRASAPTWSAAPTRVTYRWQRCASAACAPIANATGLTLRLTSRDAGHSVRFVATATFGGATVVSRSAKLAVRAR